MLRMLTFSRPYVLIFAAPTQCRGEIPWLLLVPWMTPPWIPLLCQRMIAVSAVLTTIPLAMLAEAKTYLTKKLFMSSNNCGLS